MAENKPNKSKRHLCQKFFEVGQNQNPKNKGKHYQKATYQAETKLNQETVKIKFDYSAEKQKKEKGRTDRAKRIKAIRIALKNIKNTQLYKILEDK